MRVTVAFVSPYEVTWRGPRLKYPNPTLNRVTFVCYHNYVEKEWRNVCTKCGHVQGS